MIIAAEEALYNLGLVSQILVLNEEEGDWLAAIPIKGSVVGRFLQRHLGLLAVAFLSDGGLETRRKA